MYWCEWSAEAKAAQPEVLTSVRMAAQGEWWYAGVHIGVVRQGSGHVDSHAGCESMEFPSRTPWG